MKVSHLHIGFKNLPGAIEWMKAHMKMKPRYQNDFMAVFAHQNLTLVFDQDKKDTALTMAFESKNCDLDVAKIKKTGVKLLEEPQDQPWGVRVAYIQGPGNLVLEIEQILKS